MDITIISGLSLDQPATRRAGAGKGSKKTWELPRSNGGTFEAQRNEDAIQMKTLRIWIGFVAAVVMCANAGYAQTVTGTITGTVTDQSGAVIAGATVVALNADTGVASRQPRMAAGVYRVSFLPIGRYQLTVQANGFGTQTVPPFQLEAVQTATFNVKLAVGTTAETVTVSDSNAPILNASNPTLSGTFSANTIQNFPLNGLDFSALTLYLPGAVTTAGTSGTTSIERSTYYTDSVNLNGNRAQANNYTLDGIDINESFNNLISYSPAPESLQEVKVLTANSPADYGNVNGGGVVAVLKSGTNQYHGSAYGYIQDYQLNANSWNNNHAVPDRPGESLFPGAVRRHLRRPHQARQAVLLRRLPGIALSPRRHGQESVFTQAMRNGDFSALLTGSNPIQLYDPLNGFAPYPNNQGVPIVNPVAKFLFANPKLYPLPNATPTDGIVNNNLQGPQRSFKANNQGDIKIEYDPRNSDKITAFYSMSTAYDGSVPLLAITFPGANLLSDQGYGGELGSHLLPYDRQFRAYRFYPHGLEPGLSRRHDRRVRDPRQFQGGHHLHRPEIQWVYVPGHRRRRQRRGHAGL